MHTHSHIFIPSIKKDVCYCKICSKLSYKGKESQTLSFKLNNSFNLDPLTLKFNPISTVANYKLPNHILYLEYKNKGISKILYLTNIFGLKSMIYFKSISFMNKIFLQNEISIDNIDTIASLCVLFSTEYNECCLPSVREEYISKDENDILYHYNDYNINEFIYKNSSEQTIKHKSNLRGLFQYIRNNVNNFKYWEIQYLKYLNYDLGEYSAYDYLILFFKLGIFFCEEKINIIDRLKYCIQVLDIIAYDKRFCNFSQYTFAMSIINVTLEDDNFFNKTIFKNIYGVDLSKRKYIKCSNLIKDIINTTINNIYTNININILNNLYNIDKLNNQIKQNRFINQINEKKLNNIKNNNEEEKIDEYNNSIDKDFIYKYNNFGKNRIPFINNNQIIINNINIDNYNFDSNYFLDNNCINNKNMSNNNYYISNYGDKNNNCNKNFH